MTGFGTFDTYTRDSTYAQTTLYNAALVTGIGLEDALSNAFSLDVSIGLGPQTRIIPREESDQSYGHTASDDMLIRLDIFAGPSRIVEPNERRRDERRQYIGTITIDEHVAHVAIARGHAQLEPIVKGHYNETASDLFPRIR